MKAILPILILSFFLLESAHGQIRKKNASSQTLVVKTPKKKKEANIQETKIIWISPDRKTKLSETVQIKARIESKEKVFQDQVSVLLNNEKQGAKGEVVGFKAVASDKQELNFETEVVLKEGVNKLEIVLKAKDGQVYKSYPKVLIKDGEDISELTPDANDGSKGIFWEKPLWTSTALVVDERQFQLQVLINSPVAIKKTDVYILRQGIQKIKPSPDSKLIRIGPAKYQFSSTLQLQEEGINEFRVKISGAIAGNMESEALMLNFTPHRPNIHLLSIGTQTNLDYTMKDAGDFAACFEPQSKDQGGRLFNQVNTEVLLGKEASSINIKKSIEKLEAKYKAGNIGKKDIILLYISSHGFLDEKRRLRIQGDDYDPSTYRTTSISYERDIIEVLEAIPCKKLIFIDACYSGGAKGNNEDVDYQLEELNKVLKGFTTVVSSQGDEASYEDVQWENGAFTEAILEGLAQQRANKDGNSFITINELWLYLQERVPALVSSVKKKAQHPSLKKNDLGDVAIYYVN